MRTRLLRSAVLAFALSAVGSTYVASQPPGAATLGPASPAAEAAITVQIDRWIEAFEAGDADALSSIFTTDGIYAANNGQVLRGRAGVRAGVQSWFDGPISQAKKATKGQLEVKRQTLRLKVVDGVAYSLMRFTIDLNPPGCVMDAGHTLLVWRQQPDGGWLIDTFLGNQDKVPPLNPCRAPA